jgi:hypothetical protein
MLSPHQSLPILLQSLTLCLWCWELKFQVYLNLAICIRSTTDLMLNLYLEEYGWCLFQIFSQCHPRWTLVLVVLLSLELTIQIKEKFRDRDSHPIPQAILRFPFPISLSKATQIHNVMTQIHFHTTYLVPIPHSHRPQSSLTPNSSTLHSPRSSQSNQAIQSYQAPFSLSLTHPQPSPTSFASHSYSSQVLPFLPSRLVSDSSNLLLSRTLLSFEHSSCSHSYTRAFRTKRLRWTLEEQCLSSPHCQCLEWCPESLLWLNEFWCSRGRLSLPKSRQKSWGRRQPFWPLGSLIWVAIVSQRWYPKPLPLWKAALVDFWKLHFRSRVLTCIARSSNKLV